MRKIIFSINSTINGGADHTSVIADDELHDFYADYLENVDVVLMGRKTYELMEGYWPGAHEDPQITKSTLRFAGKFNSVPKIIFTNTLKEVKWQNSRIAEKDLIETVSDLKNGKGKYISAGSLSIASQLLKENLIDEFWFLLHPIVANNCKKLFEEFDGKMDLELSDSKIFNSGVVVLHYKKENN